MDHALPGVGGILPRRRGLHLGSAAHDIDAVLDYLAEHAASLGIDAPSIGLWATSGHVPTALGALARRGGRDLKAAVLSTGFTLDIAGSALPTSVPTLIVRAGREENAGLNDALDRFVAAAFAANWPLTVVNHASVGHAFELNDDSATTKYVIHHIAFTKFWLYERHA